MRTGLRPKGPSAPGALPRATAMKSCPETPPGRPRVRRWSASRAAEKGRPFRTRASRNAVGRVADLTPRFSSSFKAEKVVTLPLRNVEPSERWGVVATRMTSCCPASHLYAAAVVSTVVLGLASLTTVWTEMGRKPGLGTAFAWHPILMTLAFACLMPLGLEAYRRPDEVGPGPGVFGGLPSWAGGRRAKSTRIVHGALQGVAGIISLGGLVVMMAAHWGKSQVRAVWRRRERKRGSGEREEEERRERRDCGADLYYGVSLCPPYVIVCQVELEDCNTVLCLPVSPRHSHRLPHVIIVSLSPCLSLCSLCSLRTSHFYDLTRYLSLSLSLLSMHCVCVCVCVSLSLSLSLS